MINYTLDELREMYKNSEIGSMRRVILAKQIKRITGEWP